MERVVHRTSLHGSADADHSDSNPDLAYWLAQPVQARIDAVETLRRAHHDNWQTGATHADIRLQRVCRITQRAPR